MRIDKKGAAHFEMITSFVFFMGFVFFLFMVLTPQDTGVLSGAVIGGFYNSFEEMTYTNLSSVFLRANRSGNSCFKIDLLEDIFDYSISDGSYVAKLDGSGVDSDVDNGDLRVDDSDHYFKVLISPVFTDENPGGCIDLLDYELGSVIEKRVVFYDELMVMRGKYYSDHDGLRSDLNIPAIFDFSIVSEGMPEINMEPASGIPDAAEVTARDYVIEVLRANGTLTNERFYFKVW